MPSFLIIEPEPLNEQKAGRGARGKNLEIFLGKYFGNRSVSIINHKDLTAGNSFVVDHLFIGIPSAISKKELGKISFNRLHLFDYGDHEKVNWGHSDEDLLRPLAHSYLKSWTQEDWGDEFNWGTLPIRRSKSLCLCVKANNLLNRILDPARSRPVDTTFLGNPVVGWKEVYGDQPKYTRVHWLDEISSSSQFTFSGGFFMRGRDAETFRFNASEKLKPLFLQKGRMNFLSYFNLMLNSKTALAPPGNALWSYRHYESIYAGTIPISADFRRADMLVPLPKDGMMHVGKGESVLPHVDQALKARKDDPRLPSRNLESLDKYLTNGLYDRKKSLLLERFMKQIEESCR